MPTNPTPKQVPTHVRDLPRVVNRIVNPRTGTYWYFFEDGVEISVTALEVQTAQTFNTLILEKYREQLPICQTDPARACSGGCVHCQGD
jgi:hypothetical protein